MKRIIFKKIIEKVFLQKKKQRLRRLLCKKN